MTTSETTRRLRRYSIVGLLLALVAGGFLLGALWQNAGDERDRAAAVAAQQEFNGRICVALPSTAAAAAEALVDVIIADRRRRGATEAELENTRALGFAYVTRARERALAQLPECQDPVSTPPIKEQDP